MDIRSIIESDSPAPAQARTIKQARQQPDRTFQGSVEVPPITHNTYGEMRRTSEDRIFHPATKERMFQDPVRSRSLAVNGMLNAPPVNDRDKDLGEPSLTRQNTATVSPTAKSESNSNPESFVQQELYQLSTSRSTETQPGQRPTKLHYQDYVKSPPSQAGQQPLLPLNEALAPASPTVSQKSATQQLPSHYSAGTITLTNPLQQPVKKKRRPTEVPIYAQSSRSGGRFPGANAAPRHKHFSAGKPATFANEGPSNPSKIANLVSSPPPISTKGRPEANHDTNGNVPPGNLNPLPKVQPVNLVSSQPMISTKGRPEATHDTNGNVPPGNLNPLPTVQPISVDQGPLTPWEPSIINVYPSEEIVRWISDFLYTEVVCRDDVGVGPAGGGVSMGAVFEIEAKIGQLIDKHTNERLRLPVKTECALSPDDPSLRVAFKSSMTEAQHRSLNVFLNNALVNSQKPQGQPGLVQPSDPPRIPMSYVHTYERDTFYELSQSGALSLPASIRAELNPRQPKAKVRVTTDQKTDKEIARIIKARVADRDIYSPSTAFDWRVSVNIEMSVDGDLSTRIEPSSMNWKRPERNKDRMSYRHLAYQIDLTQVKPSEATSKIEKEHELEIEVSSAEVRKQGLLLRNGLPNDYEQLIKGFVDNVRLLARHCQR